ncbi:MAG: formate dehydrogenase accessory sulfurtransferase FdhD [Dorea sp.]|nr:formate dehydrogenase accessory sulfurtransferase FdhD [Dorea sp.]
MVINEMYPPFQLTQTVSHTFLGRDGQEAIETEEVLVEHMLEVYINDKLTMKLVCIPENLAEMVLGRLLSEGIIKNSDDVEALTIDQSGTRADVVLVAEAPESEAADFDSQAEDFVEITPSACTSNHILNDYFVKYKDTPVLTSIPWKKEWIFALADKFASGMPIHSKTWSTHSAFLAQDDTLLFSCEDIGRHNALDKAIGYAIRNHVDLGKCILYSSGRVPTDMVMKVIHAGVPVFASKASLTGEAVELARNYNLTLICAARRDRMKLYTGPVPEDAQ